MSATTPGDALTSALGALASTTLDYACAPPNESAGRLDLDVRVRGAEALGVMSSWPDYQATPLRSLERLAAAIGIKSIFYKDESTRFGLGSFKPMGAAYALGDIGPDAKDAVPALKQLANDRDKNLREAAAYALKHIEPPAGK